MSDRALARRRTCVEDGESGESIICFANNDFSFRSYTPKFSTMLAHLTSCKVSSQITPYSCTRVWWLNLVRLFSSFPQDFCAKMGPDSTGYHSMVASTFPLSLPSHAMCDRLCLFTLFAYCWRAATETSQTITLAKQEWKVPTTLTLGSIGL